jgi:hypothetical protein
MAKTPNKIRKKSPKDQKEPLVKGPLFLQSVKGRKIGKLGRALNCKI